jgi:hypothetical protein
MFVKYWGNNYNVAGDMKLNLRDLFVKLMGIILDIWGHPSAYVYE